MSMTLYAPVFIDTSQADCSVLSAAALLLTAPIVLPILGVVYAAERFRVFCVFVLGYFFLYQNR